jgi:cysteine desulfurase / selenocysteine lyase
MEKGNMKPDIRNTFPFLQKEKPLIFLDNAATTQKPQSVIDALSDFYSNHYSTIHRGIYSSGEKATQLYQGAREKVATFIGARPEETIFTKGTTEGINFVAATWGDENLNAGDEILLTQMEHHANIAPWQELAQRKGLAIKFIPLTSEGTLDLSKLPELLTPKTKLVGVTHISNVLGTLNPIDTIVAQAHKVGARVLVDAAQSVGHIPINVAALDVDFLVFSGHKMLAPTGIGVLYIKKELHDSVPPYQFGGGMIKRLTLSDASYVNAPERYEAGTPPIAQAIGLGAAVDYLNSIGFEKLSQYESELCAHLIDGLSQISNITLVGPLDQLRQHGHLVSFAVEGVHAHDVAAFLDKHNIAIRAGHFCAQPLIEVLGKNSLNRISLYLYNTKEEINYLLDVLNSLCKK